MKLLGGQNSSMVLERSVVDPNTRTLVLKSRNVTLTNIMTVEETCTYQPVEDGAERTRFLQEAKLVAWSGWSYIREALEDFSVNRFQTNAAKGRQALEQVLQELKSNPRALFAQKFGNEAVQEVYKHTISEEALRMAEEGIIEPE